MRETLPKQDDSTEKDLRTAASVPGVRVAQPTKPSIKRGFWWIAPRSSKRAPPSAPASMEGTPPGVRSSGRQIKATRSVAVGANWCTHSGCDANDC